MSGEGRGTEDEVSGRQTQPTVRANITAVVPLSLRVCAGVYVIE